MQLQSCCDFSLVFVCAWHGVPCGCDTDSLCISVIAMLRRYRPNAATYYLTYYEAIPIFSKTRIMKECTRRFTHARFVVHAVYANPGWYQDYWELHQLLSEQQSH